MVADYRFAKESKPYMWDSKPKTNNASYRQPLEGAIEGV